MKIDELTYQNAKIFISSTDMDVASLIPLLTNFQDYSHEFHQFKIEKRQKEFLIARILLNKALGAELIVDYHDDNKPFLRNRPDYISITHSKAYVAVITHPQHPVGIDIECRTDKTERIAKRFLSADELRYFEQVQQAGYYEIAWSAKEVLFKIIGKKVINFSQELEILPFQLNNSGSLNVLHVSVSRIYRLQYIQNEYYSLVFGIDKRISLTTAY